MNNTVRHKVENDLDKFWMLGEILGDTPYDSELKQRAVKVIQQYIDNNEKWIAHFEAKPASSNKRKKLRLL